MRPSNHSIFHSVNKLTSEYSEYLRFTFPKQCSSSLTTDLQGSPLWVSDPDEVVGEADVLLELPEQVDAEAGAALAVHCGAAAGVGSGQMRLVSRHHAILIIIFCIFRLTLPLALPTKLSCGNMMNYVFNF